MQLTQETNRQLLTEVFEYEGHNVRVAGTPESPLFVAADVCRVLGIGNPSQAMARLDEDEKGIILNDTPSGDQKMLCVTESGLYSLILGSRKPEARAFSSMSRSLGIPVGRITDPRFGLVNTYHIEVLDEVAARRN